MRVVSGKARSIRLGTPKGYTTRPTADRIKETLFNIINPYIYDCNFLDLFAGSGAMGIEAISRGAKYAAFVDNNPAAIDCIKKNLKLTKLEEQGEIFAKDAKWFIQEYKNERIKFDLIFIDPPYHLQIEKDILFALEQSNMISEKTIIIIEASLEAEIDYLDDTIFKIFREKKYKTNQHIFLEINHKKTIE